MKYAEFKIRTSFTSAELAAYADGCLVTGAPGRLPLLPTPPFLMFDRVTAVEHRGPRGRIVAEFDVSPDLWFFQCHFKGDPVQPGCLELDAVWQLMGFYASLRGALGAGRALGCASVDFSGQIRPHHSLVRYEVDLLRASPMEKAFMSVGSGRVFCDDEEVCRVEGARVGVFSGLEYQAAPLAAGGVAG